MTGGTQEKRKKVQLSRRLRALAELVTPGNVAADVGCDHGFLSIYLVEQGICPRVIASDVRKGPLSAARAHVAERGLSTYIETRLSDGLTEYCPGEAQTMICAGMGGRLMQRILQQSMETARGFRELILQPQSELEQFRAFLREQGFSAADENILEEDGKYYFLFRVRPGTETAPPDRLGDKYGSGLLRERHPVLRDYLEKTLANCEAVRATLLAHRGKEGERARLEESLRENEAELADLRAALAICSGEGIQALRDMAIGSRSGIQNKIKSGGEGSGMVTVTVEGVQRQVPRGTTYEAVIQEFQPQYDNMIAVVAANGRIRELFKKINRDCTVTFFTLKDDVGHKTYVRTATMLFFKAVFDVFGAECAQNCRVEFTVGHGSFIDPGRAIASTPENAEKIKRRMLELVEAGTPFMKRTCPLDEAMDLFKRQGMRDKEKLFRYRMNSQVNIYEIEGYYDYYYGYMLPNAGYVKYFDVINYESGFMLLLPTRKKPLEVAPFREQKKLFATLEASESWGSKIGIENVGDLNDEICKGSMSEFILMHEAEQERKIGEIAREIVSREGVKFVMIAGPSSSGKTSFSHRLSIQLRTLGKTPHPIALDDYFVDRENTPRDEKGDYNFECLEALDTKQFNDDMCRLLAGERVELPTFNFKIGKREYQGNYKQLGPDDILVLEGIHGLNDKMSYALPKESKFKIYISALTTLNIDGHNRIPTTDGRLLRRMVRDARTRGSDARRTIQMWPSVRRGEEENIFPFQEDADVMFNSALIYELAVLKQFAEPLLFQIPKDAPEYYEAKRLLKFLSYFLNVTSESLPNNSICREFVGGSCFRV